MNTNKKVLVIVFMMLGILSISIILNVWVNFVDFGKKSTIDKANSIAESVRDGLTAHMILDSMDKRELFLENMIKHQKVRSLRVIRSKKIIQEFGDGTLDPYKYDDIEKNVLNSAQTITKIVTHNRDEFLRITIPYIATKYSNPNCLTCHVNVKEGEVLGAISLELDISEIKETTYDAIVKIIIISIAFLILAFFIAGYYIRPYIKLFDDLEEGISKAYKGDFSHHVTTNLSNEAGKVAQRLNDLSEIFRFKKTIELDSDKEKIYSRIQHILEKNFDIKQFVIFENNILQKVRKVALKSEALNFMDESDIENSDITCRSFQTNLQVCSTDFYKICDLCYKKGKESICLPFTISDEFSLTLLIYVNDEVELKRVRELVPIISNYFELTEPVLQTKFLMKKLHEKALIDPMTTLYNRRFLENYLDNELTGSETFSIMMIDIDYFKQVNDTYGHDVGDDVIVKLAEVLKNHIKGSDLAIRYGGEEFLLITFNTSIEVATKIANAIRVDFSKQIFKSATESFSKTLSIGISNFPNSNATVWQSIKFADIALYNAKERGRDRVIIYKQDMEY